MALRTPNLNRTTLSLVLQEALAAPRRARAECEGKREARREERGWLGEACRSLAPAPRRPRPRDRRRLAPRLRLPRHRPAPADGARARRDLRPCGLRRPAAGCSNERQDPQAQERAELHADWQRMPGDPVNPVLLGEFGKLHGVVARARWTEADTLGLGSSWRMVVAFVLNRAYPAAAFSTLYLFGRRRSSRRSVQLRTLSRFPRPRCSAAPTLRSSGGRWLRWRRPRRRSEHASASPFASRLVMAI